MGRKKSYTYYDDGSGVRVVEWSDDMNDVVDLSDDLDDDGIYIDEDD